MRLLCSILIGYIVCLFSFGGLLEASHPEKEDCCAKMAMACHKTSSQHKTPPCGLPGCAMMFSCSICGFVVEPLAAIKHPHANLAEKPVAHYILGNANGYRPDNWKPPKAC